jgi:hypothetical protein
LKHSIKSVDAEDAEGEREGAENKQDWVMVMDTSLPDLPMVDRSEYTTPEKLLSHPALRLRVEI